MKPLHNHVKIELVEQDDFIKSSKGAYEEIGIVEVVADGVPLSVGDRVYFDSWLAKKYPIEGQPGKFHWFVKYEDIVAYEPLPKQPV